MSAIRFASYGCANHVWVRLRFVKFRWADFIVYVKRPYYTYAMLVRIPRWVRGIRAAVSAYKETT
jgi:hypothetical protein